MFQLHVGMTNAQRLLRAIDLIHIISKRPHWEKVPDGEYKIIVMHIKVDRGKSESVASNDKSEIEMSTIIAKF
jgi:hypothetical protein